MNAAIIILTILGCDDSGTECHYVATSQKRWTSIEMCSASSESELVSHANAPYPVIIAVCQEPQQTEIVERPQQPASPAPVVSTMDVTEDGERNLAMRAISRVKAVLPTTEGVRTLMQKPVRLVEESYSWVARKF
ncbi:MAG: hypothetical protein KJ947_14615 [Alphaproteobacteria bacterium]|nr:hypothetical protein [Alphaproteobacteria bacterium]MBU1550789.1 hypothetical protein [Alphaproteobacteria bacterium]MBU2338925.1 hypothetical protein [Alphaproteobacteria bacterium]MBU2387016.1 hypothetical protein [Alphaproteobacteria bacterium]|tara:strand:- start:2015 stop:2419 length:405 start_codon:yes stop_codon:yes gene_type:complete